MNWLEILQLIGTAAPAFLALIEAVAAAINAAPPDKQAAVHAALAQLAAARK